MCSGGKDFTYKMKTIKELEAEIREHRKEYHSEFGPRIEMNAQVNALKEVVELIDEINEVDFKGEIKGKVLLISKDELKSKIEGTSENIGSGKSGGKDE